MRLIQVEDIADIALGSSLLGAGGGGDPYMGSLETTAAIRECGPVRLLDADEVPDDWTVASIGSVGAPSVVLEKGVNGQEYVRALDLLERRLGRSIDAFVLAEAGGLNSLVPIAAAARVGIPVVNVDGMGRAFPGLQQDTYCMAGVPTTPMAFVDEKGNRALIETIDNDWTEAIGRAVTTACGGSLINLGASMSGAKMKECAVRGTVDLAQRLGRIIRTAKDARERSARAFFLEESDARLFLCAKIVDVLRETRDGYNFGRAVLEGVGDDRGACGLGRVPEREPVRRSGRARCHERSRLGVPGGCRYLRAGDHRVAQVRQTCAISRIGVRRCMAHASGRRVGRPCVFRFRHTVRAG